MNTLPSGMFHGLHHINALDLSANNISHTIGAGSFANPDLAYVSLAYNKIEQVEPGAFGKSLDFVWLTGNNLTCVRLAGEEGALPSGAICEDEGVCGGKRGLAPLRTGVCSETMDRRYNTEECRWDGGDCDGGGALARRLRG